MLLTSGSDLRPTPGAERVAGRHLATLSQEDAGRLWRASVDGDAFHHMLRVDITDRIQGDARTCTRCSSPLRLLGELDSDVWTYQRWFCDYVWSDDDGAKHRCGVLFECRIPNEFGEVARNFGWLGPMCEAMELRFTCDTMVGLLRGVEAAAEDDTYLRGMVLELD